jgi:hypothetical protein
MERSNFTESISKKRDPKCKEIFEILHGSTEKLSFIPHFLGKRIGRNMEQLIMRVSIFSSFYVCRSLTFKSSVCQTN